MKNFKYALLAASIIAGFNPAFSQNKPKNLNQQNMEKQTNIAEGNNNNNPGLPKKTETVFGLKMAYVETGTGDPIVFLHGNPTSSYLWRNIMPHLQKFGRCVAPDLIGMGASDKIPNANAASYSFTEQRKYLDQLLSQLSISQKVVFVVHDWGSALAFDWAYRHPNAVKGIAYMEAIVQPYSIKDMPERAQAIFSALRSPAGEKMVLEENSFIEINLPGTILRKLSDEEMNAYRKPFLTPGESRRAMLSWARQLPLDGKPEDVTEIVNNYGKWLSSSTIPKLFIEGNPGTMPPAAKEFCKQWKNQVTVVVKGIHYVQEDSPGEITMALSTWFQNINQQEQTDINLLQAETNKSIIRNLYENILNNRKLDRLGDLISDDYVGIAGAKGVAGFSETVQSVIAGFPDIHWEIKDMFGEGDRVAVRWSWKGTNTGSFRGFPASNKPVVDNANVIYQLKDNKIINAWIQGDRLGVLTQMGVLSASQVTPPTNK